MKEIYSLLCVSKFRDNLFLRSGEEILLGTCAWNACNHIRNRDPKSPSSRKYTRACATQQACVGCYQMAISWHGPRLRHNTRTISAYSTYYRAKSADFCTDTAIASYLSLFSSEFPLHGQYFATILSPISQIVISFFLIEFLNVSTFCFEYIFLVHLRSLWFKSMLEISSCIFSNCFSFNETCNVTGDVKRSTRILSKNLLYLMLSVAITTGINLISRKNCKMSRPK